MVKQTSPTLEITPTLAWITLILILWIPPGFFQAAASVSLEGLLLNWAVSVIWAAYFAWSERLIVPFSWAFQDGSMILAGALPLSLLWAKTGSWAWPWLNYSMGFWEIFLWVGLLILSQWLRNNRRYQRIPQKKWLRNNRRYHKDLPKVLCFAFLFVFLLSLFLSLFGTWTWIRVRYTTESLTTLMVWLGGMGFALALYSRCYLSPKLKPLEVFILTLTPQLVGHALGVLVQAMVGFKFI